MKYLCLIYSDEADTELNPPPGSPESQAVAGRYWAFNEEAGQAGVLVGGDALHPTDSATSVRVKDGEVITTDGPFAETKEQLGGYYMIECDNLDEAIKWASKIPHAEGGTIEVRPVMDYSQEG